MVRTATWYNTEPLFQLGQIVATPGALEALKESKQSALEFLLRHKAGEWGDCCPEDAEANETALADGSRIFSVYHTTAGEKLWIITEAKGDDDKRFSTCILLPSEY